jgi:hypothetical protein
MTNHTIFVHVGDGILFERSQVGQRLWFHRGKKALPTLIRLKSIARSISGN